MSELLARFDATLAQLGLASEPWSLHGRKLRGTFDGRAVQGSFSPRTTSAGGTERRRYLGHRLELEVGTPLGSRLIVFPPSGLRLLIARTNAWFGLREVPLGAPLRHLRAWASDPAWASTVLADLAAATAVAALLPAGGPAGAGIHHAPGKWTLSSLDHGERVLASLPGALAALIDLAERAEALPAPSRPYRPTWPERHPRAARALLLVGCPAFFVLLGLLVSAALISLSWLAAQGG
jgi:hypothetical protein